MRFAVVGAFVALVLVATTPTPCAASPSRRFAARSSAVVTIQKDDSSFFGSSAYDSGWGAALPPQKTRDRAFYPLVYTTSTLTDPFGCTSPQALANRSNANIVVNATNVGAVLQLPNNPFVLLVNRGLCSYSLKALYAAQLGAVALVVTDTQQQAYNRSRVSDATREARALEFSCANGRAEVDAKDASKLYDFTSSSWRGRVNVPRCTGSPGCESGMCIPSGAANAPRQVCCLWDVADPIGFATTDANTNTTVDAAAVAVLPVVRLLIADGDTLKTMIANATRAGEDLLVTLYERKTPLADPSQFIIWLLAIMTVTIGGYKGATVERERALRKQSLLEAAANANANGTNANNTNTNGTNASSVLDESVATRTTAPLPQNAADEEDGEEDETLDLTMYHALGFVVFATAFLLVLFYWNVVLVVIVLFAVGSVSCSYYVLWQPLFEKLAVLRVAPFASFAPTNATLASLRVDTWRVADVFAFFWSLCISVLWFVCRNRQYAWLLQDVFGVCLCVLFLRTIRLPNLKVATFLLALVFCYDIFMVFISGYIFRESLMISAATGGGAAAKDSTAGSDDYCIRYPSDTAHKCVKETIPILLRFPKVIDWRAGQSMLGLGDIVLPGLLVVFCARFDYATRGQLLGRVKAPHLARLKSAHHLSGVGADLHHVDQDVNVRDNDLEQPPLHLQLQQQQPALAEGVPAASRRGLFGIMMWGYAIGLLAANVGVMVMKEGQPALMYIVPCTLGVLHVVAWRRGITRKLWDGPEEFRARAGGHGDHADVADATDRSLVLRDRRFTVDHVIHEREDSSVLEAASDTTPVSRYSRSEATPKHGPR